MIPSVNSIFFLLVSYLPAVLSYSFLNNNGCQSTDHTSWHYIYFKEPSERQFALSIKTQWYYYALDLESLVPTKGFEPLPPPNQTDVSEYCRWKYLGSVWGDWINRGDITFKDLTSAHNDLYENSTHRHGHTRRDHLESADRPSVATIAKTKKLLLENAPTRDVAELMLEVTVPVIVVLSIMSIIWRLSRV
jgi:hypothetical protein